MSEPIETKTMTVQPHAVVISPDNQTEVGLALLEERVRVARQQLSIVLRLVAPSQIIVMDGGDGRETCYFTGGAADKILRFGFGMRFSEWKYEIHRTDKETTCTAKANLLQQDGSVYEPVVGMRALTGFVRNERDLIKGAIENGKHQIVTTILGLRFLSKADYKDLGLDLDKLDRRAEFQTHDKDPDTITVPFGKNRGEPITEVSDRSLQWLAEAVKKSVDDPAKSKWKTKNQALLDALRAEYKRRHKTEEPAKPEPTPEPNPEHDYGPAPMSAEETREALDAARNSEEEG